MTKMKIKKMTKSTIAVIIMGVVLACVLAFGGTYAYFTGKATQQSTAFKTGYVKLTAKEAGNSLTSISLTDVMPTQTLVEADKIVLSVDTTETGNYVAIRLSYRVRLNNAGKTVLSSQVAADNTALAAAGFTVAPGSNWLSAGAGHTGVWIYKGAEAAATPVKGNVVVNNNAAFTFDVTDEWVEGQLYSTSGYMGADVQIVLEAYSIQSTDDVKSEWDTTGGLKDTLLAKFPSEVAFPTWAA